MNQYSLECWNIEYKIKSIIISKSKNQMYSTSSTQMNLKTRNKTDQDTGLEFTKEQSFSFQVQAQRQYVHRLKMQREKIQALYSKYDLTLQEMKRKQQKIKQQQRKINQLSTKCKQYSLLMPELDVLRKENAELLSDNENVRYNLTGIQESYLTALNQYKSKSTLNEKQRQKIQQFNEQLITKLRMLQQKMEDKHSVHEKDRKVWTQKIDALYKQIHQLKTKHVAQISIMNSQILQRDESLDILTKQNQKLRQVILHLEQTSLFVCQQHQQKLDKLSNDYKLRVKSVKQQVDEQIYNNEILTNKINLLNLQIQNLSKQNISLRDAIAQQKRKTEQSLYEVKLVFNQQKSILREHNMQLQSKLVKIEKQLADSLRREKDLVANIKRIEEGQQIKKSLREVERRELQKINRLLLLEK